MQNNNHHLLDHLFTVLDAVELPMQLNYERDDDTDRVTHDELMIEYPHALT